MTDTELLLEEIIGRLSTIEKMLEHNQKPPEVCICPPRDKLPIFHRWDCPVHGMRYAWQMSNK